MEVFGFYFTWIELIIFSVMFLSFLYQLYFYLRYMEAPERRNDKVKKNQISFSDEQPPISIIIAAKNEEENLRVFLPKVLSQNYPEYEVIVIDDASDDNTSILLDDFKKQYPNLRTSFIPDGTKNISSKKLAVTLGVKASSYDYLLFTDADCFPESENWIANMVRNFTHETQFVLGYGAYLKKDGLLNRLITYDTLFIGLQYMGMALAGKPYMGVGRNMAYRKELFFRVKGFSSNLDLLSGDDDLIVNQAADGKNTRTESMMESITWSEPKKTFKAWYNQKRRHLSASKKYRTSSKLSLGLEPLTRALFYLSIIAMFIFGNLITYLIAGLLFLFRLIIQLTVINKASSYYKNHRYYFTLPLFDIFLPLVNLTIMLAGGNKKQHIHW